MTLAEWGDPDRRAAALDRAGGHIDRAEPARFLSPRQRDVLRCASHGLGQQETADALGIGVVAVRDYRTAIRRALAAKTTAHAVAEAMRLGILD